MVAGADARIEARLRKPGAGEVDKLQRSARRYSRNAARRQKTHTDGSGGKVTKRLDEGTVERLGRIESVHSIAGVALQDPERCSAPQLGVDSRHQPR